MEEHTGFVHQPNSRRAIKRMKENWQSVHFVRVDVNTPSHLRSDMHRFIRTMFEEYGKFKYYHDFNMRRWYFNRPEIAMAFKLKYGGISNAM